MDLLEIEPSQGSRTCRQGRPSRDHVIHQDDHRWSPASGSMPPPTLQSPLVGRRDQLRDRPTGHPIRSDLRSPPASSKQAAHLASGLHGDAARHESCVIDATMHATPRRHGHRNHQRTAILSLEERRPRARPNGRSNLSSITRPFPMSFNSTSADTSENPRSYTSSERRRSNPSFAIQGPRVAS